MDIEKGFKRITWVLSISLIPLILLFTLSAIFGLPNAEEWIFALLFCWIIGFVLSWFIYGAAYWIISGFRDVDNEKSKNILRWIFGSHYRTAEDKKSKDEQKQ